jgi:hypothetical protein
MKTSDNAPFEAQKTNQIFIEVKIGEKELGTRNLKRPREKYIQGHMS